MDSPATVMRIVLRSQRRNQEVSQPSYNATFAVASHRESLEARSAIPDPPKNAARLAPGPRAIRLSSDNLRKFLANTELAQIIRIDSQRRLR
jgi:hypothetical protein